MADRDRQTGTGSNQHCPNPTQRLPHPIVKTYIRKGALMTFVTDFLRKKIANSDSIKSVFYDMEYELIEID